MKPGRINKLWESRSPRERAVLGVLAAAAGIMLYSWLAFPAGKARAPLLASVAALRAQAAQLDRQAIQYEQLRKAPPLPAPQSDVRTLVQIQASASGLPLTRVD